MGRSSAHSTQLLVAGARHSGQLLPDGERMHLVRVRARVRVRVRVEPRIRTRTRVRARLRLRLGLRARLRMSREDAPHDAVAAEDVPTW
tara:strand:+ start:181 stop:447 length:267 start_codon:yes stop_codon:yes gene_type:complete